MISVVVLTLNEEGNLPRCLASVAWSDDVLVVDSGSSDRTVEIAIQAGARVLTRAFDSFAGQRNFAMEAGQFRHRWVLHLDADEVVTDALREELLSIASRAGTPPPVYRLPSRLMFMGRWLRRSGMYPAYQVRFGRSEDLRFIDHGHGQREVQSAEQVGTIASPLDHHNFSKGIRDWFERHLRYADAEAQQAMREQHAPLRISELFSADTTVRRRALKRTTARLPGKPLLRFLYAYLFRGGWLDGRAGLRYACMLAIYQYFIDLRTIELRSAATLAGGADVNSTGSSQA